MELTSRQLLSLPPYNDDYDRTKNFHRVLFRPATAVQARELTQLQTILQDQVSRMGDHIFKNGSIVKGCSLSFIDDISVVRCVDFFEDRVDGTTTVDQADLVGSILIGATTGVQAVLLLGRAGFEASPAPNRLFVRYTMPGRNGEQTFAAGERIDVHADADSFVEQFVVTVASSVGFASGDFVTFGGAGVTPGIVVRARVVAVAPGELTLSRCSIRPDAGMTVTSVSDPTRTTTIATSRLNLAPRRTWIRALATNHTDVAFGAAVTEGIIFHKGHFVRVSPHFTIVDENSREPTGKVLGFTTEEVIVTEYMDPSLYDNAAGFTNFNAPGGHRLQLISTIEARDVGSFDAEDQFFPIAEFSGSGVVSVRTDPEYARLGDEIARRTYEESGNYTIAPHSVTSNTHSLNSSNVEYVVGPGLSYVQGRRVQLLSPTQIVGRRGVDTVSYDDQIVSMNYGNFIRVREFRGFFPSDDSPEVLLYDTPQLAVTNGRPHTAAPIGAIIGRANLRNVVYDSSGGPKGSPAGTYKMFLFNVRMAAGRNFETVRSVVHTGAGRHAVADVVLNASGSAVIEEASYSRLVFGIGARAVRDLRNAAGNRDTSFYYTAANTGVSSLQSDGTLTFQVPNGGGILGFNDTTSASEARIDVSLVGTANVYTSPLAGTVNAIASSNTVIGTNLDQLFFPGEFIRIGAVDARVVAVANSSHMTVSPAIANVTGASYQRMHVAGSLIPLEGPLRTITVTGGNQATVSLGTTYATGVPAAASVRFYARKTNALPIAKELRRGTVVRIDTSNNEAGFVGPWCLGVPDVLRITGVFKGTSATSFDSSINYANRVVLNAGQEDTHYDLATAQPADGSQDTFANTHLLIQFDHFVANNQLGQGFFSVESYPVDDRLAANANTTIRTADIPSYVASNNQVIDLRDAIDFRPYKAATAVITSTINQSTVNPLWGQVFNPATTTFNPFPGQNFTCNFTHFLGRRDVIALTPQGQVIIQEGQSALRPRLPNFPPDSMSIATIDVPPFPSLASNERGSSSASVSITTIPQKRYTMRDLSVIEQRVDRLEYYATLSALEQDAAAMTIPNALGLDRFKNGIFADPLNSHVHGRVSDPQYAIAVDAQRGHGRPRTVADYFGLVWAPTQSSNVRRTGSTLTLDYTDEVLIDQPFATNLRQPSSSTFMWRGSIEVSPRRWQEIETLSVPQVVSSDLVDRVYAEMAAPPLGSQFGWWRDNVQTDTSNYDLVPRVSNAMVSVGNDTRSTSQSIYIQPREVSFRAVNLKPFTEVRVFIDAVDVSDHAAPATGASVDTAVRTAVWGTRLVTNSRGELLGKIRIPSNTFRTGRRLLTVSDSDVNRSTSETTFASAFLVVDLYFDYYIPQPPPSPPPPPPVILSRPPQPPVPELSTAVQTPRGDIIVNATLTATYAGFNTWNLVASASARWSVDPSTPLLPADVPNIWTCRFDEDDVNFTGPGPWLASVRRTDAAGEFTVIVSASTSGSPAATGTGMAQWSWQRPSPVPVQTPPVIVSVPTKPAVEPIVPLPVWVPKPPPMQPVLPPPPVPVPINPTVIVATDRSTREWVPALSEYSHGPLIGGASDNAPITATIVASHPTTNNITVSVVALDTVAATTALTITPQADPRVVVVGYDVTNRAAGVWLAASNRLQITATATAPGNVVTQTVQVLDLAIAPNIRIPQEARIPQETTQPIIQPVRSWIGFMPRFEPFFDMS